MSLSNNSEIISKLQRFCLYQTRCKEDVKQKLIKMSVKAIFHEKIIADLTNEGFINESNFLAQFINGKFRYKKWGKQKIKAYLVSKNIKPEKIDNQLRMIDSNEYIDTIYKLVDKKLQSLNKENLTNKRLKLSRHLIQKGFAPNEFLPILDRRLE
jgi:regulatory protein